MKSRTCFKKNGKPRSVYSSLVEAKRAAIYEKSVHGVDLVPYRCDDCGEYHNSPKDRVTPSKTCPHCIDGNGRPKELYESREAACRRADIIYKTRGVKLDVYPCPYKSGYHLTKG
jgi:predicted Zn-ribbon and HTH transcriptional regulator